MQNNKHTTNDCFIIYVLTVSHWPTTVFNNWTMWVFI